MKKQKPLVTILVINFNNSKFIDECINSLKSQTYHNIEIIFFDDNSKDDSLEVIKKYEHIKIIENKFHSKFGSLNQINGFKKGYEQSNGEIIFLLDSDDYFSINKIDKVVNFFLINNNCKVVFDYPIIKKNGQNIPVKKKKFFRSYWGYIHPTSCIAIRKQFFNELFDKVIDNQFFNIWMDFRILLFSKYIDRYYAIDDHLTFYRQFDGNVSSKFNKFSKTWWKRRSEAHDYFFNFVKCNNLKVKRNLDFYVTKLVNKFL